MFRLTNQSIKKTATNMRTRITTKAAIACLICAAGALAIPLTQAQTAASASAAASSDHGVYPPWQHGANDDRTDRGLSFTEPDADNLADFHGNPIQPMLSLYVGGNYFFAMAPLVHAFEARYPQYKGHVYWETIPPGLLVKQMENGGTVTVGNMTWTVKPDVYLAGLKAVQKQIEAGTVKAPAVPYVTNTLTIMVPKDNPAHITGLADLGRPDVRLAMPNPEFEGIARQIKDSLAKAGGDALVTSVYTTKVSDGTTLLTHIHHRQTPLWIMQGKVQAGVTWQSEAMFQEQIGHAITHVDIPDAQNTTAVYAGGMAAHAPHPQAAQRWLTFIRSPQALTIFEQYGFKPYTGGAD
jgi:molybdate transport system substrate-binding protein